MTAKSNSCSTSGCKEQAFASVSVPVNFGEVETSLRVQMCASCFQEYEGHVITSRWQRALDAVTKPRRLIAAGGMTVGLALGFYLGSVYGKAGMVSEAEYQAGVQFTNQLLLEKDQWIDSQFPDEVPPDGEQASDDRNE